MGGAAWSFARTVVALAILLLTIALAACQLEPEPPVVRAVVEPDLSLLFPTDTPVSIVVGYVTRLPTIAPTATPSSTPTTIPTPTHTPTPPPTEAPTPCAEAGRIVRRSYFSRVQGPERYYRVYLPPCYGQDGRVYPTLYMLHGNVRGDEEWDVIGLDDSAEILIQNDTIPPMMIVMPDGRTISDISSGGPWSYEDVITNELLPHIEATYCSAGDASWRAIGGLSRGGYWSFEIAFRNQHLFTSAGSHSGSFLDTSTDVSINPLYTASRNDLSGLRLYMDYGGDDWSLNTGIPLHQSLLDAGVPHEWLAYPSGGHDDPYWRSHVAEYLIWYSAEWSADRLDYATCASATE